MASHLESMNCQAQHLGASRLADFDTAHAKALAVHVCESRGLSASSSSQDHLPSYLALWHPRSDMWQCCLQDLVESGQLSRHARLLVTGHSLGGALAVLAAMDIKLAMSDFCMEMYTYGTPYPGNRAFAREFDALLPNTWHVIHDGVSRPEAAGGD